MSEGLGLHLCRKLLDPGLASSSRQNMFLNLLYKSLKADVALRRIKAFVKRLLQVSAGQSASFVCGALFLVSELMKAKPGLKLLLQEAGVRSEPRELLSNQLSVGKQVGICSFAFRRRRRSSETSLMKMRSVLWMRIKRRVE